MGYTMLAFQLLGVLVSVQAAIDVDGNPAIDPVQEDEPSPIDGFDRFWPDQHDCPLPCYDYSNIHSWIPYISVGRLQRCKQPMLLQFSVTQPLDDPGSTILIRSCLLGAESARIATELSGSAVDNPKMEQSLLEPPLDFAPACRSDGTRTTQDVQLLQWDSSGSDASRVVDLISGMGQFFDAPDNCDESFVFAYHGDTVASVFIGKQLGRETIRSALATLSSDLRSGTVSAGESTIMQMCSDKPERSFGIALEASGSLVSVQNIAQRWSKGDCLPGVGSGASISIRRTDVWELNASARESNETNIRTAGAGWNNTLHRNATVQRNGTLAGRFGANSTFPGARLISSIGSILRGTSFAQRTSSDTMRLNFTAPTPSAPSLSGGNVTIAAGTTLSNLLSSSDRVPVANITSSTSRGSSNTHTRSPIPTSVSPASVAPTTFSGTVSLEPTSSGKNAQSSRPANEAIESFSGRGVMNCSGKVQIALTNGPRDINSTISCNGFLTRNRTLACDGRTDILSDTARMATTNGTMFCNGTLHANGTIEQAAFAICNGTLRMFEDQAVFSKNVTFSCNGTLTSNGTLLISDGPTVQKRQDVQARQTSGTCATHLIQNGDTCFALGEHYGVTVDQIEGWNRGKTWGWQGCADLLVGYVMCITDGAAPMPAPQHGTQCGPLVPGTRPPTDSSISLADLNPCPLKACCSNWGFCGVFPAHCTINAPPDAAPGAKNKDAQNTCISHCGNSIRQNSGPPALFGRVGYYSAFAYSRSCLHLPARRANTDGTYTIIHWAFAEIDPSTWNVIISDPGNQWEDFKALRGVKRVISFGGWAYSTEPATYDIIRRAILTNYEAFTDNVVRFVQEEGLDGVDIDWEYPGAPDILVNGRPIGQRNDGRLYLRFLRVLRSKLGSSKLLAIAAPASYWYLKAFPIDLMSEVLDYIVYMTYDLHGQWDFGNPNAFDNCDSGKCIRSHVNLTETRNALGMVTKAGVPTNKIFVGESSYARTFHMAQDGCWQPMCEFTGSRTESDAAPGRCTKTGGYLANAEIDEIIKRAGGARVFHDQASNSDIILYQGDYMSYMTTTTKDTRRQAWRRLNFAGSIDWALDLQAFDDNDLNLPSDEADSDGACNRGTEKTIDTAQLCRFSCEYGFCPAALCECTNRGTPKPLPPRVRPDTGRSVSNEFELDRLCVFACQYNYCPPSVCLVLPKLFELGPVDEARLRNSDSRCTYFKSLRDRRATENQCRSICRIGTDNPETTNWNCVLNVSPNDPRIEWQPVPGYPDRLGIQGHCECDIEIINILIDSFIEALPYVAAVNCFVLMSSIKLVLDIGMSAFGAGRVGGALGSIASAAELVHYTYSEDQDPAGAFEWWLSPCGDTVGLVPEELRRAFDIMQGITGYAPGVSFPRGSGRKGDQGNPLESDRGAKRPQKQPPAGPSNRRSDPCNGPRQRPWVDRTVRMGRSGGDNTVRVKNCRNNVVKTTDYIVTSVIYPANPAATTVPVIDCPAAAGQACYHYSSAIAQRPAWDRITCPQDAATTSKSRTAPPGPAATRVWETTHKGAGWLDVNARNHRLCEIDEYPPAYLMDPNHPAWANSGTAGTGQLIRWLPGSDNANGGDMWKAFCLWPAMDDLSDQEVIRRVNNGRNKQFSTPGSHPDRREIFAEVDVDVRPVFRINSYFHTGKPLQNKGLDANPCWPSRLTDDPGFTLLTSDPYYGGNPPPYDYSIAHVKPGSDPNRPNYSNGI